jgi:outer membrane protein OmpA-like peptidoglycan-associated protein
VKTRIALVACLGVPLTLGCASKNAPIWCAQAGLLLGGAGGALAGAELSGESDLGPGIAGGAGGAVLGAAAGYALCRLLQPEEPKPEPRPAPEPPPPPPPAPKPAPPPEPEPDRCDEVIRLRGVTFGFDEAVIRPADAVVLDESARVLKDVLGRCPTKRVRVDGHTDATGPEAYNQTLSERRAEAVRQYLAGAGLEAGRIASGGFGESRPIASNDTREGRTLNRRVELSLED